MPESSDRDLIGRKVHHRYHAPVVDYYGTRQPLVGIVRAVSYRDDHWKFLVEWAVAGCPENTVIEEVEADQIVFNDTRRHLWMSSLDGSR